MPSDLPDAATILAALSPSLRETFARVRAVVMDADGVLTDGRIHIHTDGAETMSFDVKDGSGLWMLHRSGIRLGIITGRSTGIPEFRGRSLPIDEIRSGVRDKDVVVKEMLATWQVDRRDAVFVADDVLDGPALQAVGLPVCVADATPEVKRIARYVTRRPGGRGAVREVADLVLEARGDRAALLERFLGPRWNVS